MNKNKNIKIIKKDYQKEYRKNYKVTDEQKQKNIEKLKNNIR